MSRTLNSTVTTQRHEFAYLYELHYSGGALRLTNASADIVALSQTWQATGGRLLHEPIPETDDRRAQGVMLRLYGVDQTIVSTVLSNQFRGQPMRIYLVHTNPDTGVFETPDEVWRGLQNGDYNVKESRDTESDEGGNVEVSTRITSRLALLNAPNSCRSNLKSHQDMCQRAGLATTDTFFERIPALVGRDIYWGTEAPDEGSSRYARRQGGGQYNEPDDTRNPRRG